jgi:hypothetical protein
MLSDSFSYQPHSFIIEPPPMERAASTALDVMVRSRNQTLVIQPIPWLTEPKGRFWLNLVLGACGKLFLTTSVNCNLNCMKIQLCCIKFPESSSLHFDPEDGDSMSIQYYTVPQPRRKLIYSFVHFIISHGRRSYSSGRHSCSVGPRFKSSPRNWLT